MPEEEGSAGPPEIADKNHPLIHPDMGRLCAEAVSAESGAGQSDAQVSSFDGPTTDADHRESTRDPATADGNETGRAIKLGTPVSFVAVA